MDTSPWDLVQRELNSAILLKLLADREKACGFLVAEELKDELYFYIFWKLHDNQIKDLLRKDGINGCLEKPMEFDKLLTAITSRGFFLTLSRSEQFSSFPKNNLKL